VSVDPRRALVLLAMGTAACGADETEAPPLFYPDVWREDGCRAGELEQDDGSCRPAGILPDECGEGFVHDGLDGCDPVLPAEPCPPGSMAIPGETVCHEVAPCGSGSWGDIPGEPSTQWVDDDYQGSDSDGSQAKPWTTVQQGVLAASPGAIVAIAAGSYVEHLLITNKNVRLWGKCPAEVAIVGPPGSTFVIDIRGAGGTEIHDLAATGSGLGIATAGSEGVLADRVWIHDTSEPGFLAQDFGGATSSTLRRSLVENATGNAAYALGASITVEASVLRDSEPGPMGDFGRGVTIAQDPATLAQSSLALRRSLVERNHETGVSIYGSPAEIDSSVIRDTLPRAIDGALGAGVAVWRQMDTQTRAAVTVRRSVVATNRDLGITATDSDIAVETTMIEDTLVQESDGVNGIGFLAVDTLLEPKSQAVLRRSVVARALTAGVGTAGVDASIESVVARDVEVNPSTGITGRGMTIELNPLAMPPVPGTVSLRGSLVEHAHEVGVSLVGVTGLVESTLVRQIAPRPTGLFGRGVSVEVDPSSGSAAVVTLDRMRIEEVHEFGIFVVGSQATIDRAIVRDVHARPFDGALGVGLAVQMSFENGAPASASLQRSTVERTQQSGIFVAGATTWLESIVVTDTFTDGVGRYGDGLIVSAALFADQLVPTEAHAHAVRLERSARAGLSSFAASVWLGASTLECNPIHIDGETFQGIDFTFTDEGANVCGCAGATEQCKVLSTNLTAPEPVDD
jgi:hypothetical protein